MSPRTSFLIPVRDGERTLGRALASALAQRDPDFEVVLVDDGSVDRSAEIARATGDSRVRVHRGSGGGVAVALQEGLALCRGRYIARMDADDLAVPNRLCLQLPVLEADPTLALVDGQCRFFRDVGPVPEGMQRYGAWVNGVIEPEDFDRLLLLESPVVQPAATLRRTALDSVGGYRMGDFPEDYDLWLRLHTAGWRMRKIPEVLVHMRDRPERLTRTDPRYRHQAFDTVRRAWLEPRVAGRQVALVGAGKRARPWVGWLAERGCLAAVIDVRGPGPDRGGAPVLGPDSFGSLGANLALVAVGSPDQRPALRAWIASSRPDLEEGGSWWFV